jgi:hypothetical protein
VQLVEGGALQDIMELRGGLLVARMVRMQVLDPSPRRAIAGYGSPAGRVRRGAVDTHDLIVVAPAPAAGSPR